MTHEPTVHVEADPPFDVEPIHHIKARSADGLNAVEISLRFDKETGPSSALRLLARAALEVVVHARAAKKPASREAEGSRWHG